MIKKQQKWIAVLVAFTFMWLLQVSTMPVAAANAPEQIGAASNEQGPSFVEEEGDSEYQAPKKSILPIILIGVGVIALAAVLFLVVLKTTYDITGTWSMVMTGTSSGANTVTWNPVTFTGDKKTGAYQIQTFYDGKGTYTVDGKNVTMTSTYYSNWTWTGTFTAKTTMTGTSKYVTGTHTYTWSWTATKNASATTNLKPGTQTIQSDKSILEQMLNK